MLNVEMRTVVKLAVPAMGAALLQNAFRPLDHFFVRPLGGEAQAALGATSLVAILCYGLFQVVGGGAAPLVARAAGARDPERIRKVVGTSLVAALSIYAVLAVVGVLAVPSLVHLLGLREAAAGHAEAYLRVLFLTGVAWVVAPTVDGSFQALGDTRTPLKLQVVALVLNAALTPLFIRLGFGTGGAALGSTLAQSVGMGLGLWTLAQHVGLRRSDLRFTPVLRLVLQVGWPLGMSTVVFAGAYWAMMGTTLVHLEPAVYAALGIGFSALEGVAYPVFVGWMVAVSSLIGRCLGAGRPELAWQVVRMSAGPGLALGLCFSVLFWLLGPGVAFIFAADEAVYQQTVLYASVLAFAQPLVAAETLAEGVLSGAGDTTKVLATNVPLNILRVPLAYGLAVSLGFGAVGLWWAINLSTAVKASLKWAWVWQGGWAQLQLEES